MRMAAELQCKNAQFTRKSLLRSEGVPAILQPLITRFPLKNTDKKTFSRHQRLLLVMLGAGLTALLALATMLRPSPWGNGTHRQLGLPPCTFKTLLGRPCPTCGMTTSWAYLVRGDVFDACQANVSGTLLGLLALAAAPWLLVSAWRGTWTGVTPQHNAAAWISGTFLAMMLIEWTIRLACG